MKRIFSFAVGIIMLACLMLANFTETPEFKFIREGQGWTIGLSIGAVFFLLTGILAVIIKNHTEQLKKDFSVKKQSPKKNITREQRLIDAGV